MRVTKVIREYIEQKVEERYPMPEEVESAARFEYNELMARCTTFIKNEAEKFIKAYVADVDKVSYGGYSDCDEQKIKDFVDRACASFGGVTLKVDNERQEARRKLREKREKAVREIIVELELGATKADLADLLANLPD
jgi:hypothetical protein